VKRKILLIAALFLIVAMLATPAMAAPTNGQKVPITIHFSNQVATNIVDVTTGDVLHRSAEITYDIAVDIDGVPTYTGVAVAERDALFIPRGVGVFDLVLNDDYIMTFDGQEGTFEGHAMILLKDYAMAVPTYEAGKGHALLQGTGVFEGQTINAGHHWLAFAPITWYGYWLKM
jgi:hypothetical protein